MKNKAGTRFLSLLLSLALALSVLPAAAFATEPTDSSTGTATANTENPSGDDSSGDTGGAGNPASTDGDEDTQSDGAEVTSVTVSYTAQAYNGFLCPPQHNVSVSSDLAERYGLTDKVTEGVSALDVLVAANLEMDSSITKDNISDYIALSSGSVTTAFGMSASTFTFAVNGLQPNDGVYNAAYNAYTGYTIDQAQVQDGDVIEFAFLQDSYWSDSYVQFYSGEESVQTVSAGTGASVSLTLKGYAVGWYGCSKAETIAAATAALSGLQLAWVDANGGLSAISGATTDADGKVSFTAPTVAGTYWLTAYAADEDTTPAIMTLLKVVVEAAPTAITVKCSYPYQDASGNFVLSQGDKLQFTAYDQDGAETPVTWSTSSSWVGSIDADGAFTVTTSMSAGGSSYIYVTATSALDAGVKSSETRVSATGYEFSSYNKNLTVALPQNGGGNSASLSGGVKDCNTWSWSIPDGVASVKEDPGTGTSASFTCMRPGVFTVSVSAGFDGLEPLTDTATVTVTGVAVETASGKQGSIRLYQSKDEANPTAQLTAYTAEDTSVARWSSTDESVVTVDDSGKITAQGVGSAYVYAEDTNGAKGGIQVKVGSEETPYFDSFELYSYAFVSGEWTTGTTFVRDQKEYNLNFRYYSTSSVSIQSTTAYDTDKYTATATYTDLNGETKTVAVNSGASTSLANIGFGTTDITVSLTDKSNSEKHNDYVFHITRPRDTAKAMKSSGIVLVPEGRSLNTGKYNGYAEGTMFRADETGAVTGSTGVTGSVYNYRTYLQEGDKNFALMVSGSTAYAHLRYSTDGTTWTELTQGGGTTGQLTLPEEGVLAVQVQILDDTTYAANVAVGKDGFAEGDTVNYTVWVEGVDVSASTAQLLTAESDTGDWYPAFVPGSYSYRIAVPYGTTAANLTFTAVEGAAVSVSGTELTPDDSGVYTLALSTAAKTVTVTSADGSLSNSYSFSLLIKSKYDGPDQVVDYLCINSQYTNAGYGLGPETTLSGSLKSLGNFGGYITYYFENPLTDNENNKYGVDFYVYGNAYSDGGSFAEPGQVWVSEDGENWYALAGSEHYEDSTIWDYTVTYTKTASGKTAWTDNQGNSKDGSSQTGNWPLQTNYPLNSLLTGDSITLSGILLPSSEDGTIQGTGNTSSYSAVTKFGYADYYKNGTYGVDVNPYGANPTASNGFDLEWAVDGDGNPIDVSGMEFHYVKVVTASNIWAGVFNEKSTEVSQVVRTTASESAVGTTAAPAGVTITGNGQTQTVDFAAGQQVYEVNVGDMSELSIAVNGAGEDDNIYINNQRIAADESADGFFVSQSTGEKLVRVIVQNGEAAPVIYLLKITSTSSATESSLITGITATAQMSGYTTDYKATSEDGENYTIAVDNNVTSVLLKSFCRTGATTVICNAQGEAVTEAQALEVGDNTFTIKAEKDGRQQTVTLTITRAALSGDYITVVFSLLGDSHHTGGSTHTLAEGNLTTWIAPTTYTVAAESTVLDVLEQALTENSMSWTNAGGNYVTEVNGLSAFDNGSNSGWMFTLNGVYGNYGVKEQTLSDGDTIVFHYTDDYSKEDFSGNVPTPTPDVTDASLEEIYATTGNYLISTVTNPVSGSIAGDWAVLGLARAGYSGEGDYYQTYYNNVATLVKEKQGVLSKNKYTEYSRTILGLTAAGYDPRDVEGYDLTAPLADFDKVVWQGVNGPIWALIALDSGNYAIPAAAEGKTQTTRENLVEYILSRQLSDGGWATSASAETSDVDMTAMAIQALAPYYADNTAVRKAVDQALNWLSRQQDDKGGFANTSGDGNSESCAQVVVALTALGINPATDSRFTKNGVSALGALCAYYVSGGGFRNVATDNAPNGMATEQGYYALVSYVRFLNQQTSLYDMTDVTVKKGQLPSDSTDPEKKDDASGKDGNSSETGKPTAAESAKTGDDSAPMLASAALMASAVGMWMLLRKKKQS